MVEWEKRTFRHSYFGYFNFSLSFYCTIMERTDAHVTIQLYTPSSDLWPEETYHLVTMTLKNGD